MNQASLLIKASLSQKFSLFEDHFSPKTVGELNDSHVKLLGELVWHHHEQEDEMFLVAPGCLLMAIQEAGGSERQIAIHPGEFITIPQGVEHKPRADEQGHILLLESKTTLNTATSAAHGPWSSCRESRRSRARVPRPECFRYSDQSLWFAQKEREAAAC